MSDVDKSASKNSNPLKIRMQRLGTELTSLSDKVKWRWGRPTRRYEVSLRHGIKITSVYGWTAANITLREEIGWRFKNLGSKVSRMWIAIRWGGIDHYVNYHTVKATKESASRFGVEGPSSRETRIAKARIRLFDSSSHPRQ